MAQIKSARIVGTNFIGGTPVTVGQVEQAIATILGIPQDTEISGILFGDPNDGRGVTAAGKIAGIVHLVYSNSLSDVNGACGFVFENSSGSTIYKIANIGDNFGLWSADAAEPDSWTKVLNLNEAGAEFLTLGDVDEDDYTDHAGEYVKVNAGETGLEFGAGGAGVDELADLTDVPAYASPANDGNYLRLKTPATGGGEWVAGGSASGALDDLSDVTMPLNWPNQAGDAGELLEAIETTPGSGVTRMELIENSWAYGVGTGTTKTAVPQDPDTAGLGQTIPIFPLVVGNSNTNLINQGDTSISQATAFTPDRDGLYYISVTVTIGTWFNNNNYTLPAGICKIWLEPEDAKIAGTPLLRVGPSYTKNWAGTDEMDAQVIQAEMTGFVNVTGHTNPGTVVPSIYSDLRIAWVLPDYLQQYWSQSSIKWQSNTTNVEMFVARLR